EDLLRLVEMSRLKLQVEQAGERTRIVRREFSRLAGEVQSPVEIAALSRLSEPSACRARCERIDLDHLRGLCAQLFQLGEGVIQIPPVRQLFAQRQVMTVDPFIDRKLGGFPARPALRISPANRGG